MSIADFAASFGLGLLTPLTAICVLPLYPGFLAYLANQFSKKASRKQYALLGLVITAGVMLFMFLLGIIFTTILQVSLTTVIGIISPIAFSILGIISIFLIFDIDIGRFFPKVNPKITKNPLGNAFLYGFFFGAIVIPCNPAFIAAFLARVLLLDNATNSIFNFLFFGLGLGFPLLLFSFISARWSSSVISILTKYKTTINRIAWIIMLVISLYYLIFVFQVFG